MTKNDIINMLMTNDKAVARALVVLNERQTFDEQCSENTRHQNGRGFRPCHARMGTSMAKFYQRNKYLSPKQIAYWRQEQRDGKSRIAIYAGQLLEVAQNKAAIQSAAVQHVEPTECPGNVAERELVLSEIAQTSESTLNNNQVQDFFAKFRKV